LGRHTAQATRYKEGPRFKMQRPRKTPTPRREIEEPKMNFQCLISCFSKNNKKDTWFKGERQYRADEKGKGTDFNSCSPSLKYFKN
jgi:hypothetical protein